MIKHAYIHIPFCVKKCNYCSFCSFPMLKKKGEYLLALISEINRYYKKDKLKTLYFGGGTPGLLDVEDIEKLINLFNFENDPEITLEINPCKMTYEKLKGFFEAGINRLSIGAQSFNNEILQIIGREHSYEEFLNTLNLAKKAGFQNISIDLMYGLPNQTQKEWGETIEKAKKLDIEHISLYGLKIETGTYFKKNPPKNLPNDDMQAKMYEIAIDKLQKDFVHYEFSSFARKKALVSHHNLCYWQRKQYYGFGLAASGFIHNSRYTNTVFLSDYIKNPLEKNLNKLSKSENIEEEAFLNLRTMYGLNFNKTNRKYNIDIYKIYKNIIDKYLNSGHFEKTKTGIRMSKKGILVSNLILCEFIEV